MFAQRKSLIFDAMYVWFISGFFKKSKKGDSIKNCLKNIKFQL